MSKYFLLFFFLLTQYEIINATETILNKGDFGNLLKNSINIAINDTEPLHVHPAGKPFILKINIEAPLSAKINYQWLDYQGKPLSSSVRLNSKREIYLQSPDSKVGYYGLTFSILNRPFKFTHLQIGEKIEYGFAIINRGVDSKRLIDSNSPFGIVHAQLNDSALPAWIKTLTWKTYSPRHWKEQILKRNQLGLLELPMIVGYEWETDDTKIVSNSQLAALGSRIRQYFIAQPEVLYWELGREENLKTRFNADYYWHNLEQKINTIRAIANEVNPKIKFIYQIAGLNLKSISKFAQSMPAKRFDILSLHPYAWPDFITPEKWLARYLENARQILKAHKLDKMPIWFTEVGVPHQGNFKGGFFGYPELNRIVKGHSQNDVASYAIKLHILALSKDVQKIFWYNYKDRQFGRKEVENHFGLVDFWGYPKPVYAAYINLIELINGKEFSKAHKITKNIRAFEFNGNHGTTWAVWCFTDCKKNISWSNLLNNIQTDSSATVVNIVGTELEIDSDMIHLSNEPIFIRTKAIANLVHSLRR